MKKKGFIALVAAAMIFLSGCGYSKVDSVYDAEDESTMRKSMFIEVEHASYWKVVYHKDTKVMYAVSYGGYAYGVFTLLVNPDGTPMLWED